MKDIKYYVYDDVISIYNTLEIPMNEVDNIISDIRKKFICKVLDNRSNKSIKKEWLVSNLLGYNDIHIISKNNLYTKFLYNILYPFALILLK